MEGVRACSIFYIMMEHIDGRLLFSKYKRQSRTLLPPASKEEPRLTKDTSKTVYFDSEDSYIKKYSVVLMQVAC